jgi:RNA recognition motif-containing protein
MAATGKIYIGNTSARCTDKDLQSAFGKFGSITRIDVKRGFAFVVRIS